MKINYKQLLLAGASIAIFGGCATTSSRMQCTPEMISAGFFCYSGMNFGKNLAPNYKKGVIDGCRTGKGYFVKDYDAYRDEPLYKQGWIAGRKKCHPTYDDTYMNYVKRTPPSLEEPESDSSEDGEEI